LLGARAASADDFYWNGPAQGVRTVEIRNISGWIHAEPAKGNQLEVYGTKRSKRHDPERVKIESYQEDGRIVFCAIYPNRTGAGPNVCTREGKGHSSSNENDLWVEFRVLVPKGMALEAHTVNGDILAEGLSGPISAGAVNGEVRLSTSSYAEASTVNGNVTVVMTGSDWPEGLDFRTVNGSIQLDVSGTVNADLRAETMNGAIASDFPLMVQGRARKNRVHATIGKGGTELALATLNGSIDLRRAR
jgi:hypothetical protein